VKQLDYLLEGTRGARGVGEAELIRPSAVVLMQDVAWLVMVFSSAGLLVLVQGVPSAWF
jgi:hypothetical protein